MTNGSHGQAAVDVHPGAPTGMFRFVPLFLFILILYLFGLLIIKDPRAPFISLGAYHLSWVEVLLVCATVVSLLEQMKVSHPGIDNTMEALGMIFMGVLQLVLFALGAANVPGLKVFSNTEFLILTIISLAAAVVAVMINARTLRRTIGVGDN